MENKALLDAIYADDYEKVCSILIEDPAIVSKEALFLAAQEGKFEILKYLVEYSRISLNEYDDVHRNVLFYGARSGDISVFRYLVEKCGMDPLMGDKNLVTPWDIVHEPSEEKQEIEKYLEERYGHKYEDFYHNPIRTGFFPDPSICRVGDDYYMVNSSFIFFPCIPISHSKDLINWEIIGHAITDPKWAKLDGLEGGRGYWAPDISFYKGKFYITATYRLNDVPPTYRRQIVVSSDKPQGPYSEPVFIDEDGIDPSIFNDDDGKRYMLLNRGARIFELDESGTRKISEAKLLFYGDHKRAPEGPHLYKKDGYYYLLEAEGGTGPGHRVTVSRSKELFGNYEPCPYNPIMRQKDPEAGIQRCGHGDLVETGDGRWYMVYLCGRMIGDGYSILGRETAIDPVTWTMDGWPVVNGLKGPSVMQVKPFCDRDLAFDPFKDDNVKLSPCCLPMDFMTPRPFNEGDVKYDSKLNSFEIKISPFSLSNVENRCIVLKRQTAFSFDFEVTMEISKLGEGQCAGITGYYDENTYLEFGVICKNEEVFLYSNEHVGKEDRTTLSKTPLPAESMKISFRMETDYLTRRLLYRDIQEENVNLPKGKVRFVENKDLSADITNHTLFMVLENVYYLCDEGLKMGKRFTGAMVGMYTCSKK